MGQFYYNRLRNNRIKGMSLGLFFMLTNVITIYYYYLTAGKDNINLFIVVAISFTAMGLLYIMGLITFGQVIEKTADGQITTFYRLGSQKLRFKTLGRLTSATLKQDTDKYYCLAVKTSDGHDLILEKYPTLHEANERLEELQMRIE